MRSDSELEPKAQLHLARAGGSVGAGDFSGGLAKGAGIGSEIPGLIQLHTIEQIIDFGAEFNAFVLGEARGFLQNGVPIVDSRPKEFVAAEISSATEWWNREESQVRTGLQARIDRRE